MLLGNLRGINGMHYQRGAGMADGMADKEWGSGGVSDVW